MNYIWSKHSLLKFIHASIEQVVGADRFLVSDLFAGTGAVARMYKELGHPTMTNDLQYYSYVLLQHYLANSEVLMFSGLESLLDWLAERVPEDRAEMVCLYLDQLSGMQWFVYQHYCMGGTQWGEFHRQYFSDTNGARCDAIRMQIQERYNEKMITDGEYFFLLASLIESIDKVANTASVYGAYLKQLKKSAQKDMVLTPALLSLSRQPHQVYQQDINELIQHTSHEVVYLDPPYNHRQYSGNYHVLETIARYDDPVLRGKTGMRDCSDQKSKYCSRVHVLEEFHNLMQNIDAQYVFLSYNDEGLMSLDDIRDIMSMRGEYGVFEQSYQRYKADKTENRNHKKDRTVEYLHRVKVEDRS